jgi:hypothetical protein
MRCLIFLAIMTSFAFAEVDAPKTSPAPPKISRIIRKEPIYVAKAPQYFLLALGRETQAPVWLVLDGETLYVDCDANGDLTDPGEGRQPVAKDKDELTFEVQKGEITSYKTAKLTLRVVHSTQEQKWRLEKFTVRELRNYAEEAAGGWFGDSPETAGVNEIQSGLMFFLRNPVELVPGKEVEVYVWVGSRQPNGEPKKHCCVVPSRLRPAGELVLPALGPDEAPIRLQLEFGGVGCSCCTYVARLGVPQSVGKGTASLSLSFPDWEEGDVTPTTLEVPVNGR